MLRLFRSFSPVVCLVTLAIFASHAVKADDTSTTQPSASGSIVVTVLDADSKPVEKARVQIFAKKKAADTDDNAAKPAKPKALARGATDEDGKYTFSGLASGDYKINASLKKTGGKGTATVSITDDAPNGAVTINFSAPAGDSAGGATTAPAQ
jgi:Carboxypeptidase regulatory-like domain